MSSGIFLLFSIGILGGIISGALLKKARAPQVLGYILTGLIIGQSGLKLISLADIQRLETFNLFALAMIGFLVGSEIKISDMKRYGRQFSSILLGEGLGAFFLVGIISTALLYRVTGQWNIALAGGLIFGAISSATDPASTMSVLWEKRSAGILTTTIIAVIALDDALAILLYSLGSSLAQILATGAESSITHELIQVGLEIPGSLGAGVAIGLVSGIILKKFHQSEQSVTAAFGIFLFAIALSRLAGLDIIIVAMAAGVTIANREPHRAKPFIRYMKGIAAPVYVIFFVLTGARLTLGAMPGWLWLIVILFVAGRSLGKVTGSWLGARMAGASSVVRRLTGLGLFCQGGVAIGLSIIAGHHLEHIPLTAEVSLGDAIISAIAATTFLIQIIGPAAVSAACKLSGEMGLDISLDDLIARHKVRDIMPAKPGASIREDTTIAEAIHHFSETDGDIMPVTNEDGDLLGVVTFEDLRHILAEHSLWTWSLVTDIMTYDVITIAADDPLEPALDKARAFSFSKIPVTDGQRLLAMLDAREVKSRMQKELLRMQEEAFDQ